MDQFFFFKISDKCVFKPLYKKKCLNLNCNVHLTGKVSTIRITPFELIVERQNHGNSTSALVFFVFSTWLTIYLAYKKKKSLYLQFQKFFWNQATEPPLLACQSNNRTFRPTPGGHLCLLKLVCISGYCSWKNREQGKLSLQKGSPSEKENQVTRKLFSKRLDYSKKTSV